MRWIVFIPGALLLLTVQSAIAPRVELFGARPDWLLAVVVFFALYSPAKDAAIGAWVIGAGADLLTIERVGLIALTYLLIALLITSVREYFFRYRALTQFIVTLAAAMMVRLAWSVYSRSLYEPGEPLLAGLIGGVLLGSVYTAAWAPLLHRFLMSTPYFWGIGRPRYGYTGSVRLNDERV